MTSKIEGRHAGNLYIVKFGNGFFPPLGTDEVYQIVVVPEPTGVAAVLAAVGGLLLRRRRGIPCWRESCPHPRS